ncbi:F41 fimbrial protein [Escherichia marmotae]|uniref:F4 family fimbrial subunit n=1 Tax=Escherichia marmotae TaxID=1499973 RepID=UPI003CF67188
MKKTLVALAVAASAIVSGSSVAALGGWTESQPNGPINIGGTVTLPPNDMKWLWAVGEGMNNYKHTIRELSNGNTALTISVADDTPFLAAKMNKAVALPILGIIPKVEFKSYDQSVAAMDFQSEKNATLTVKVRDVNDALIGNLVIPLTFGAGATNVDTVNEINEPQAEFAAMLVPSGNGGIFEGIVKPGTQTNPSLGLKWSGVTTTEIKDKMLAAFQDLHLVSGLQNVFVGTGFMNYSELSHGNYTSTSDIRYAVYGAGIPAGSSLSLKFNKAIKEETEWKAPVTVNVTYQ